MEGLSYSVAEDDDLIFKVYTGGYSYKQVQVIVPICGATGIVVEGFTKKIENTFKQNPKCIGQEGECFHRHTSVTVSTGDILAFMIQLQSNCISGGNSVTKIKSRNWSPVFGGSILNPPLYKYREGLDDYWLLHSGSFPQGNYYGTYTFSNAGSTSIIRTKLSPGFREQRVSITNVVCDESTDELSYDLEEIDFVSSDSNLYKDFLKKGYKRDGDGAKAISRKRVTETRKPYFIKCSRKQFRKARKNLMDAILEYARHNAIAKVHFMPVEESFLDDLYESLAIPSMNSVATILELLGSVRNAKNVAKTFKYIKRNGGIRQTLIKEGSSILKDKKLSTASNLYLTKKYVYDTTRMDVDDFFEKLSTRLGQLPFPVQHFRWNSHPEMNSKAVHCIRLAYQPYEYSNAELYGFDLPMEATWDVIPYSFIIDWFCSFGDSLESIDKVGALQKIKVVSCTESIRVVTDRCYDVKIEGVTVQFYAHSVFYNRTVTNQLPPVYPRSPKLSNPFHHIIDGAALVFARR